MPCMPKRRTGCDGGKGFVHRLECPVRGGVAEPRRENEGRKPLRPIRTVEAGFASGQSPDPLPPCSGV